MLFCLILFYVCVVVCGVYSVRLDWLFDVIALLEFAVVWFETVV